MEKGQGMRLPRAREACWGMEALGYVEAMEWYEK